MILFQNYALSNGNHDDLILLYVRCFVSVAAKVSVSEKRNNKRIVKKTYLASR